MKCKSNQFGNYTSYLRAVARGVFLELTYSKNQVGHSENYGNNSITKF
jgi:hypothetical protein